MKTERITEVVKLQNYLNEMTCGENWRKDITNKGRNIDWSLCILMESAELYDSLNWKHWKNINEEDDIENAKIEIVDIFHFVLSSLLKKYSNEVAIRLIQKELIIKKGKSREQSIRDLMYVSAEGSLNALRYLSIFGEILFFFKMSFDELFDLYIGKNILNMFRQDNGYKTGTYIKMWGEYEDNVIMQDIIIRSGTEGLYRKLATIYNGVKCGLIK